MHYLVQQFTANITPQGEKEFRPSQQPIPEIPFSSGVRAYTDRLDYELLHYEELVCKKPLRFALKVVDDVWLSCCAIKIINVHE